MNSPDTTNDTTSDISTMPHPLPVPASSKKSYHPMEGLLRMSGSPALFKAGDIVSGVVIEKKGGKLYVDLDAAGIGIVYGKEYMLAQDIVKSLHPGDPVSSKVVEIDNADGYIELSLQEAGREKRWVDLKRMMQQGDVISAPVKKANTGGLILELMNIEGFLPASQLSFKHYPRVEGGDKEKIFQELQKLVGSTINAKILDLDPEENKLIFTEKGLDSAAIKTIVSNYKIGDVVEGEITGVVDFGAFMKFDNIEMEGLIHLSEIDWMLVKDPREIVKSGERVKAKIIDIQGDKISLSLKQLKEDPWLKAAEVYRKGDVIVGKVTKFNPFGAFVELGSDIQGLAHISEFGTEQNMRGALEIGREYSFKVMLVDPKEHRISLGMTKEEKEDKHSRADNRPTA